MAVLIEALSVVVRRVPIAERFAGGWAAFMRAVPNATACYDNHLFRVGFMNPADVRAYVAELESRGLVFERNGEAVDLAVVDQLRGPTIPAPWLQVGTVGLAQGKVKAARLKDKHSEDIALPPGWTWATSLSKNGGFTTEQNSGDNLKYLRRENDLDVYLNLKTGEEVFIGRPSIKGKTHAALYTRLEKMAGRVLEIDGQSQPLKAMGDEESRATAAALYEELSEQLLPELQQLAAGDGAGFAFAHFAYGLVLRVLGRSKEAEPCFLRANELQPGVINTLNELVRCLGEQGRHAEALVFAREGVEIEPDEPSAWGNLAMCLIQTRQREEAKRAIDHAIMLAPSDPTNRYIRDNFDRYFKK